MKKKTRESLLVLIIIILSINVKASAQISGETPYHRAARAAINSEFLFEGVVVEQTFYESSPGNVFTANTIQITKIFKGTDYLQCGTVQLLSPGSSGQWVDFGEGSFHVEAGSHMLEYRQGSQGIFFCIENEEYYPEPDENPTSNNHLTLKTIYESSGTFLKYSFDPRIVDSFDDQTLININEYAEGFLGLYFDSYYETF